MDCNYSITQCNGIPYHPTQSVIGKLYQLYSNSSLWASVSNCGETTRHRAVLYPAQSSTLSGTEQYSIRHSAVLYSAQCSTLSGTKQYSIRHRAVLYPVQSSTLSGTEQYSIRHRAVLYPAQSSALSGTEQYSHRTPSVKWGKLFSCFHRRVEYVAFLSCYIIRKEGFFHDMYQHPVILLLNIITFLLKHHLCFVYALNISQKVWICWVILGIR